MKDPIVTAINWQDASGEDAPARSHLLGGISICGASMHAEAFEVAQNDDMQACVDECRQDDIDAILTAVGGIGRCETAKIDGRDYIIIITPYVD